MIQPGLIVLAGVLAISAAPAPEASESKGVAIDVYAGPRARAMVPVACPIPEPLRGRETLLLEDLDHHVHVPVQILPGEPPSVVWIVREPIPAGAKRRFHLRAIADQAVGAIPVRLFDDRKTLEIKVGDRSILRYREQVVESPEGIDPVYRRSGQIHPILTPSGRLVTDDFPPDHPHQHGLFFAWVNTTFEGHHVDFWNQKERTGRVLHASTLDRNEGPVFARFQVRLRHEDIAASEDKPAPVLNEDWDVRAYPLENAFLIDFESRQSAAGDKPLKINKYHYGGFGLRGNRAWLDPAAKGNEPPDPSRSGESDFLTSEGKHRGDGNHTRPLWVDLSGRIEGKLAGVAVLDHPDNFRFPQPVRLHPNKPYFCFAPMVLEEFEIAPGRTYVSRYRLLVHDGPADAEAIDRAWHDYAEPPRIEVAE